MLEINNALIAERDHRKLLDLQESKIEHSIRINDLRNKMRSIDYDNKILSRRRNDDFVNQIDKMGFLKRRLQERNEQQQQEQQQEHQQEQQQQPQGQQQQQQQQQQGQPQQHPQQTSPLMNEKTLNDVMATLVKNQETLLSEIQKTEKDLETKRQKFQNDNKIISEIKKEIDILKSKISNGQQPQQPPQTQQSAVSMTVTPVQAQAQT
jgi:hypothetical protein